MSEPHYDRIRSLMLLLRSLPMQRERGRLPAELTEWSYCEWHCGTTACAGGYAASHTAFIKRGLHISKRGIRGIIQYGDYYDTNALAEFFGIDEQTAEQWFINANNSREIPMSAVTPEMIADDIEGWLRERGQVKVPRR